MKKKLTSEEILKLPKKEFLNYMRDSRKNAFENFEITNPSYRELSQKEKVNYWVEKLNQSMRLQVEKGFDEYLIFSPEWYTAMKKNEPEFDAIMDEVFNRFMTLNWSWSKKEYLKRIS